MNGQRFLFRLYRAAHRSANREGNAVWMKTLRASLILFSIAWSVEIENTFADELRLPSQKQAALDFSLAGLKIGMSQESVKKRLPRLQIQSAAPKGSPNITELDGTEVPGFVQVQVFLFQDQVYAISVVYDSHATSELGGSNSILTHLKSTLGIPEEKSDQLAESASWVFTKECRVFKYIGGSEPFLSLKDPALSPGLKKKRSSPPEL